MTSRDAMYKRMLKEDILDHPMPPYIIERMYRDSIYGAIRSLSSIDDEDRDDVLYWIGSPEFVSSFTLAGWSPEWGERLFKSLEAEPPLKKRAVGARCVDMLKNLPSSYWSETTGSEVDDLNSFSPGWTDKIDTSSPAPDSYSKESNLRRMVRLKNERESAENE